MDYKYLIGPWLEIFDSLGKDTEISIINDILEESETFPTKFQEPVSNETVEIIKEIMHHCGYFVELSNNWKGEDNG